MTPANQPFVFAAVFYVVIFAAGLFLNRSGKPYSVAVLTIHKLVSLGAIVYMGRIVIQANRVSPLGTTTWLACALAALLFVAAIATGGMLSVDKPAPTIVLRVHQIAPVLTVIASGAALFLVR